MLGGGAAAVALDGSNGIDTSSTSQTQTLLPLADFHKFLGQIQGEQAGTLTRSKALLQKIDPENKEEALSYNRFANGGLSEEIFGGGEDCHASDGKRREHWQPACCY